MKRKQSNIPAGATAKTPEQVQATLALRASGAPGPMRSGARRQGTRATANRAAIKAAS